MDDSSRCRPVAMQNLSEHRVSSQSASSDAEESLPENLVEVRPAGAMGSGLFAKTDICCGTRILKETPIIALPSTSSDYLDLPAFCTELQRMTIEEKKMLDNLCYETSHNNTEVRGRVRQWYKKKVVTDTDGSLLKGKRLQDVSKSTVKKFAIFLTNRVEMGVNGVHGCGLFALYSRINHSCTPNAHNAYNASIDRLTVHTIRNIGAGEQITVSYIDGSCRTKQQRESMLEKWGFSCSCAACMEPSMEAHRQRMFELDQRLAAYNSPLSVKIRTRVSAAAPMNSSEALQDAEELVKLMKEQGLEGMDLCIAYRDCSKYALKEGSLEVARNYAANELEVERRLVGSETDHLRHDMNGAEYWLAHLEEKMRSETSS